MAVMVAVLPLICTVSDNAIPTPEEIEAVGEKMDGFVELVKNKVPDGVEVVLPTDPRYLPAILQTTTGLIDIADPESAEIAKRALEALEMTGGGRGKLN